MGESAEILKQFIQARSNASSKMQNGLNKKVNTKITCAFNLVQTVLADIALNEQGYTTEHNIEENNGKYDIKKACKICKSFLEMV